MSEDVLGRISTDLTVMQRAMGLRLFFGKGMLVVDLLLALASVGAALVSLRVKSDWLQQVPFMAVMFLVPIALFLWSGRTSYEINLQILMSLIVYAVVWVAACAHMLATMVGPIMGVERSALLHFTSVGILVAFTLILVRGALIKREQYYCLGLATSTLFAGMLLPILDSNYSYSLAHGFMAIGYLTCFAIQWVQRRGTVANYAAD